MSERKLKAKTWLRGKFKAVEPHFLNKIVCHRATIVDGIDKRFRSFMTIFIPKLTPRYTKPHIMLHVSNGGGTCLIRHKNPDALIQMCQNIIDTLNSEKWRDAWWRAENISEHLIDNGEILLEEEIVDLNEWAKELQNEVEVKVDVE